RIRNVDLGYFELTDILQGIDDFLQDQFVRSHKAHRLTLCPTLVASSATGWGFVPYPNAYSSARRAGLLSFRDPTGGGHWPVGHKTDTSMPNWGHYRSPSTVAP